MLTFDLYQDFIQAAKFSLRYQVSCLRKLVSRLPRAHQSTLTHVMRHLHSLAAQHSITGMTSRNLAIVWAPNLLRPNNQDCLRDCGLQALVVEALIVYFEEIFEPDQSGQGGCVTKKNFTKEVSIDQAVARAESFKPKTPERRMVRSISCVSTLKTPGLEAPDIDRRLQGSRFQSRGVHLKRDRSLNCENTTRHRQVGVGSLFANLYLVAPHSEHLPPCFQGNALNLCMQMFVILNSFILIERHSQSLTI